MSLRLTLALKMPSISRTEMALELGLPSEPLAPPEDHEDNFEYKQAIHEWKQRYYEAIEADYEASYRAEWRIRLRWADAALAVYGKHTRA